MKIIKIAHTVKELLIKNPETRDSDELLILQVWAEQEPRLRNGGFTFWNFARLYKDKKLASAESVRRSRQKLQEEFPNLRGNSYKAKQQHQEDVKEQLRSPELLGGGTP